MLQATQTTISKQIFLLPSDHDAPALHEESTQQSYREVRDQLSD